MFHSGCRPSVASSKCRNFSVGLECPHPAHNSFRGIFYHKFLCAISTVQCYKDESTSSRNQMESIISYVDQRIFIGTSVHPFGPSWGPVEKLGPFPSCPNDALSDGTIFTPIPQILKNTSSEPPCHTPFFSDLCVTEVTEKEHVLPQRPRTFTIHGLPGVAAQAPLHV